MKNSGRRLSIMSQKSQGRQFREGMTSTLRHQMRTFPVSFSHHPQRVASLSQGLPPDTKWLPQLQLSYPHSRQEEGSTGGTKRSLSWLSQPSFRNFSRGSAQQVPLPSHWPQQNAEIVPGVLCWVRKDWAERSVMRLNVPGSCRERPVPADTLSSFWSQNHQIQNIWNP